MSLPTPTMIAAGSGIAAVASAAVWWTITSQTPAGPAAQPGSTAPAQVPKPAEITVCVDSSRILHATLLNGKCAPGQSELTIESDDEGLCDLCDPFGDPPPRGADEKLNAIEERIRALENAAYFEVVNKSEQTIFRVSRDAATVFNKSGMAVAAVGTPAAGGFFVGRSATGAIEAAMGATGTTAGVRVIDQGLIRLDLATRDGRSSLRFPSGTGVIAGMGESRVGTGALLIGTIQGQVRASFTVPDGRGLISVSNEKAGVVALGEASNGGGMLQVGEPSGSTVVGMVHNDNRYGVVMTFPMNLPLVPKSGLPGTYFLGCSGGPPACAPVR